MEEGLERYQQVRQKVDEWPGLGPDIEVFLKRACTEYEHACGDSDTWEITKDQLEIEGLINRWVVSDDIEHKQPEKLIEHTHRQWIEWAYANGDPTYADFTGGKPLYRPYKTYQHVGDPKVKNKIEKAVSRRKPRKAVKKS